MKKFFCGLVVVAAIVLSLGAASASATTSFYTYAGYYHNPSPAGSSATGVIDPQVSTVYSNGHAASWIGVDNGQSCTGTGPCPKAAWIQAGVLQAWNGSMQVYIEHKVYGESYSSATTYAVTSLNTPHTVTLTHVSGTTWQATIDGYSEAWNLNSSMNTEDYMTEGWTVGSGATPTIDTVFYYMTWDPSNMTPKLHPANTEWVGNVDAWGPGSFSAYQYSYNGSCYPLTCNGPVG